MDEFILNVEKWFNSDENIKIEFKNHLSNIDSYFIDSKSSLYKKDIVIKELVKYCLLSYFKRIQEYISLYIKDFSFNRYSNFSEFVKSTNEDKIIYFLQWFKEENIDAIKRINKASKEYNLSHFYSVIKYYDFLVKNSLENKNYDATLDFLVEFIDNAMDRTFTFREEIM